MIEWLKRFFIPHVGNAYRPHFLLSHNIRQLLGIIFGIELILFILPTFNFTQFINNLNIGAVLPGVLSTLTNEERREFNLPTLTVNPMLQHAAQMKAEDMAAKNYFAHTSPEGKTPWYWLGAVGYKYIFAGENLAINFSDSKDVTKAWMNSPTHRANIVGGNYTEIGTGIATGIYNGQETIFVAQIYASPAVAFAPMTNVQIPIAKQTSIPNVQISETEEVLGETAPEAETISEEPTFIQKTLSSPHQTTNAILYAVLAIVLVSLFLNIVIKFEYQFPDLIRNGVVVAALIFGIYLTNSYLSDKNLQTSFLAFEYQEIQAQ